MALVPRVLTGITGIVGAYRRHSGRAGGRSREVEAGEAAGKVAAQRGHAGVIHLGQAHQGQDPAAGWIHAGL